MPPFTRIFPLRLGIVFGWAIAAAFGQAPGAAAGDVPRWSELAQRASAPATSASGREAQWRETAALAWALYESHPADPRRWTAWDALLRSVPRFADDAAAKKLWDERTAALETAVEASSDAPESLRELFAGRKVSALVLPFTNGTLPADWAERLLPPIEELAARFPGGIGAFVFFSRLISAVEAQAPAALPALVARLEASPNSRVRDLGEKRRRVLLAFARLDPSTGYVQGMGDIAARALLSSAALDGMHARANGGGLICKLDVYLG